MIQIISPTRIEVDGVDAGLPGAWLVANPSRLAEFNAMMIAWHSSHVRAEAAYKRTAMEAVAQAVEAKDAVVESTQAGIDALKAEHAAHCERLEADIAALGTKEEAQAIRERQQIDLLRRTMSDAAAQLAVLEKRT